jgi:hypothetical protein
MPVDIVGFPTRVGVLKYTADGLPVIDERLVVDPRSEMGAALLNLLAWQAGGLGVLAPLALVFYEPGFGGFTERLRYGGFASNADGPLVMVPMGSVPWLTVVRSAAGSYAFTFTQVLGMDGVLVDLPISSAAVYPVALPPVVAAPSTARVLSITGPTVNVRVRSRYGGVVLTDHPVVLAVFGGAA